MNRVWANLKSSSLFFKSLQKKLEKTPKNYFKNFQVDFETAAQNLLSWIPTLQRTACVWFLIFHAVWPLTIWTCSNKITFNIRINFTLPQHAMITFIRAKRNRKSMRQVTRVLVPMRVLTQDTFVLCQSRMDKSDLGFEKLVVFCYTNVGHLMKRRKELKFHVWNL